MSKKFKILIVSLILIVIPLSFGCASNTKKVTLAAKSEIKKEDIKYKDGDYQVSTTTQTEGFTCKAKVTIKNNKIANVEWNIYDSNNRIFDEKFEEIYAETLYKQQCRDDLKGAKTYEAKLLSTQDIEKVDAVTGATWTNTIFKKAVNLALEKASMK